MILHPICRPRRCYGEEFPSSFPSQSVSIILLVDSRCKVVWKREREREGACDWSSGLELDVSYLSGTLRRDEGGMLLGLGDLGTLRTSKDLISVRKVQKRGCFPLLTPNSISITNFVSNGKGITSPSPFQKLSLFSLVYVRFPIWDVFLGPSASRLELHV